MITRNICKAIEGLPFWLGYKKSRAIEIASESVVAYELREGLRFELGDDCIIKTETSIKEINLLHPIKNEKGRPEQLDITITERAPGGKFIAAIEIKLAHKINSGCRKDLNRLQKLKSDCPDINTYFILVSQGKRPADLVTEKLVARRKLDTPWFAGEMVVRRAVKAFGTSASIRNNTQKNISKEYWVVLIEVTK